MAVTSDGVPVVTHNPRLDPDLTRTADGVWLDGAGPPVNRLTFAKLGRLDVGRARPGSVTARAFPEQIPCDGARMPLLAEVFAATAASGMWIEADLKTDPRAPDLTVSPQRMADLVVTTARAAGAMRRLAVRSFDWRVMRHLRATCPDLPLVWLTNARTEAAAAWWWDLTSPSASAAQAVASAARPAATWRPTWAPDHAGLLAREVADAHALGLRVVPWTVNHPADMARLIAWGVDGLCTDRPDLARIAMVAAGLPPPSPG